VWRQDSEPGRCSHMRYDWVDLYDKVPFLGTDGPRA